LTSIKLDNTEKILAVLLDEILNELRQLRKALTGDGVIVPMVLNLNDNEIKVVNDNPVVYYRDVDIVNRGPGTLYVSFELLQDMNNKRSIFKSAELEIQPQETDSLSFNEPKIGKITLRAEGGAVVKLVLSS